VIVTYPYPLPVDPGRGVTPEGVRAAFAEIGATPPSRRRRACDDPPPRRVCLAKAWATGIRNGRYFDTSLPNTSITEHPQ
jgi:hypothetical protein